MVYLFANKKRGICKIGFSRNTSQRFRSLKKSLGPELEIIDEYYGTRDLEGKAQKRCESFRIENEIFEYNQDFLNVFNAFMEEAALKKPKTFEVTKRTKTETEVRSYRISKDDYEKFSITVKRQGLIMNTVIVNLISQYIYEKN